MAKITKDGELLQVPNNPTIPFVRGDGTGPDIWAASVRVLDAAVEKAYNGERKIEWKEVLAGQTAFDQTGNWLPDETVEAFREYLVGIKARSPRRWAAASAASMWRCAADSRSLRLVCVQSSIFRARPRR